MTFGAAAGASAGWMFGKFLGCLGILVIIVGAIFLIGLWSRITSTDAPEQQAHPAAEATPSRREAAAVVNRDAVGGPTSQRVRLSPETARPVEVRMTTTLCPTKCEEEWSPALAVLPGDDIEVYVAEFDIRNLRAWRPEEDWSRPQKFVITVYAFDRRDGTAIENLLMVDAAGHSATVVGTRGIGPGGVASGQLVRTAEVMDLTNERKTAMVVAGILRALAESRR